MNGLHKAPETVAATEEVLGKNLLPLLEDGPLLAS